MKKLLLSLFAALFALTLFAGDVPSGWTTDINAALARAKRENKRVLILFTGSDWCGFCVRLKNDVLNKRDFKDLVRNNFILVYFDFPRNNPPDEAQMRIQRQWQQRFSVRGYPTVIIVDGEGNKVGEIGGYRQEEAYILLR
jgi:protein disulfide-isomerase